LDPSVWNLGLPMLAIAACGPIVAVGDSDGTDSSADSNDVGGKDVDDGPDGPGSNTTPSTTMPGTVTVSTTVSPGCNYDSDCPPGYRCQYGECYYDGYCQDGTCCSPECGWYQECYSHYACPEAQECRYYSCQPLVSESVCESIPFAIEFEIPVQNNPLSLAFIESDGVPGRELLVGGDGITLHRIDGSSAVVDSESYAYDMRVRDVDGDGDEDVAFVDYNSLQPKIVLNDGMWTKITLEGGAPEALALLDVQGDGRMDVVGTSSADGVLLWIQEAPGVWSGPDSIFEPAWAIAGGDLDGDGLEDAVVHGYATNVLYAGLGASATLHHAIDGNYRLPFVGNFSGEALPGVMTVEAVNQGAIATYWPPSVVESAGWYSTYWPWRMDYARMGDVNVDGYPDIVGSGSNLAIAWGGPEADGIVCVSNVPAPFAPYALAVGDMSGDGRPDIAITDSTTVVVLLRTD
jgi:hypothetical protein